jgi:hypothetical protein
LARADRILHRPVGVLLQDFQGNDLECALMGCIEADAGRASVVMGLQEPAGTQAPAITCFQTG